MSASGCACHGLGVYTEHNPRPRFALREVRPCNDHLAAPDQAPSEAATARIEEVLAAVADVRDVLWPPAPVLLKAETIPYQQMIDTIRARLAFLKPGGAL